MPPKTVKCSVCGEEVMKSQTYATGETNDGVPQRACKEHDGILEKAQELKENKIASWSNPSKEEREEREERGGYVYFSEKHKWMDEHCWCCERPGISMQGHYKLKLVAMEKARLLGIDNPFDPKMDDVFKKLLKDFGAECTIHRFEMTIEMMDKYSKWKNRIKYNCRDFIEQLHIIQLCFDCQKKTGIEYEIIKPNVKDMKMFMALGTIYNESELKEQNVAVAEASIEYDIDRVIRSN